MCNDVDRRLSVYIITIMKMEADNFNQETPQQQPSMLSSQIAEDLVTEYYQEAEQELSEMKKKKSKSLTSLKTF